MGQWYIQQQAAALDFLKAESAANSIDGLFQLQQ